MSNIESFRLQYNIERGCFSPLEKETEAYIIQTFRQVRDIPFEAGLPGEMDKDYSGILEDIISRKRGACSAKHCLLGAIYESMEIPVKYITYPFRWIDLKVDYPDFIRSLAEKMPLQYHLAIEININEKDFLLDATWDSPLEKAGFWVNEIGEKLVNTNLGIVPCGKPVIHIDALERGDYIKALKAEMVKTGVELEFYATLNAWLENIRTM